MIRCYLENQFFLSKNVSIGISARESCNKDRLYIDRGVIFWWAKRSESENSVLFLRGELTSLRCEGAIILFEGKTVSATEAVLKTPS